MEKTCESMGSIGPCKFMDKCPNKKLVNGNYIHKPMDGKRAWNFQEYCEREYTKSVNRQRRKEGANSD